MNKWIFGILILGFSCKQKPECNLAKTIFAKPDTAHCIIWEVEDLMRVTLSYDSVRCESRQEKPVDCIQLGNLFILVSVNWNCDDPPISYYLRKRNIVEIAILKDTVRINSDLVKLENLDSMLSKAYLNHGEIPYFPESPQKCIFNVSCRNPDLQTIEEVLTSLTRFYTGVLFEAIDKSDDKCWSYGNRKETLKKLYPLKISIQTLNRHHMFAPPPPLPPMPF
jgi:hypothetical protein